MSWKSFVRLFVVLCFVNAPHAFALPAPAELVSSDGLLIAREYFDRSVDNDDFIQLARELFAADLAKNGANPIAEMYLAALGCVEAKHSIWPLRSLRLANQGLEKMEEIVKMNPKNVEIRLLYAATLGKLPLVFGRREEAARERRVAQDLVNAPDSTPVPRQALQRFKEILAEVR